MSKSLIISKNFADQLPRNLLANVIYFLANVVIGILIVPYFVSNLGVAAYGLIPLAASITGYVAIVIQSLNTAVSRFLTVDLQREDYDAANRTFNTSLFGLSAVIFLMVPIIIVVAWLVPCFFNVPAGQEKSSTLLFLGVSAAFLIRSWTGNFTVQLFAFNRLDLQNLIALVNLLIQTGLIVLFFALFGPDLVFVGAAYLAGAVVASGISIILSRRVCPYLKLSIGSFDRSRVKDLCGMGWWVVVNQVGALLFLSIDLIVVNLFFGATSAGEYAIALQWAILLRSIGGLLSGVLTPAILSYYAREQFEILVIVSKSAVSVMGLAMALPVGLVCGLAPQLLAVWVGPEFANLAPLIVFLVASLSLNLAVLPLFSINVAYNRVKVPGIVTLAMGLLNLALAVALSYLLGWSYYGVAVAGVIVLTIKNALFTPWYATKVLGIEVHVFIRSMIPGVIATLFIGILTVALATILPLSGLAMLFVAGGLVTFIYIIAVWSFGFSEIERNLFKHYLPKTLGGNSAN